MKKDVTVLARRDFAFAFSRFYLLINRMHFCFRFQLAATSCF